MQARHSKGANVPPKVILTWSVVRTALPPLSLDNAYEEEDRKTEDVKLSKKEEKPHSPILRLCLWLLYNEKILPLSQKGGTILISSL